MAHFDIPLDLPHAATVAWRIHTQLSHLEESALPEERAVMKLVKDLRTLLDPFREEGENPPDDEAPPIVEQAASMGRELVDHIERLNLGHDRLGQCVRNLFECLERGEEGARLSLRAGENPASAMRAT